MIIYNILTAIWIVFIGYWIISAFSAKKTVKRNWKSYGTRIIILLVLIILSDSNLFQGWYVGSATTSLPLQIIGLVIAALGIALAIWARIYLGKNWGMPMSLKQNPELVTSGPYSMIRHPIYSGVLLAMLGSIFVIGVEWFMPFIIFLCYFIYSATKEEKIMTKEFPDHYPAYKKKTSMLVPFLF